MGLLLFLSLFFGFSFLSDADASKCDLEVLEGKWIGDFDYYTGRTHVMIMNVSEVKKCRISGEFHWPNYFNSKTNFEGTSEGDALQLKEVRSVQGFYVDLSKASYTIRISQSDTLKGIAFYDGKEIGAFTLYKEKALSTHLLGDYLKTIADAETKFGVTRISKKSTISPAQIRQNIEIFAQRYDSISGVDMKGKMKVQNFELPLRIYMKGTDNFLMEMDFMGSKFLAGRNAESSWSYDPASDKLTSNDITTSESEPLDLFNNKKLQRKLQNAEFISVHDAVVNEIEAYRVVLKENDNVTVHFFNKQNSQLIREEENFKVREFTEFKEHEGIPYPVVMNQFELYEPKQTFLFEKISFSDNLPDSLFSIPNYLEDKNTDKYNESIYTRAEEEYEGGNYTKVIEICTEGLRVDDQDDWLYHKRGLARYYSGDNYGALSDFQRAIDLDPNIGNYYNSRGLVKYSFKDYENARKDFALAGSMDGELSMAFYNKAYSEYYLDQKDSALVSINNAIAINPLNSDFHISKGVLLLELEEYQKSLKSYFKGLELSETRDPLILNRIGVVFYKMGIYDSAVTYFQEAYEINFDDQQILENLGNAHFYNGDYEKAMRYFKKHIVQEPDNDDMINNLALCYYNLEDFDQAIIYFNKAIKINSSNATYYDNRAYSYKSIMKYQEAISDFTTSIALYPDDPEIYFQRGELNELQDNRFDACWDYKKAQDLGHEDASEKVKTYCSMIKD